MLLRGHLIALAAFAFLAGGATLHGHLDPAGWRVVDFSSQNPITGELAACAIDGDPETQWHTLWHNPRKLERASPPHFITIDFGKAQRVSAIRYRARAHGEGGLPAEYLVELSLDGREWMTASKGTLAYRSAWSPHAAITLDHATTARFLRFTALSLKEAPRAVDAGLVVGEIDVATPDSPFVPTTVLPVTESREWNFGGYDWFERHRAILAHARENKPELVFLGDSITHRWGGPPLDAAQRSGESVWRKHYAHRRAISLGYGWDRTENMLWRLRHGELEATDARLVVIMAGTNNLEVNTPEEIAAGVAALCDEIHRQKPRAAILLLAVFPRGEDARFPELNEVNERISKLGQRSYITFKDIGSAFLDGNGKLTHDVMPDLLHPAEEGYLRWARAIEPEVARLLGDRPVSE